MPTLDINADKWETIKFISANKLSIPITEGGKRRGVKALKEDLEKGGYIVGVKGKSKAPKQRGVASSVKAGKNLTSEQRYAKLLETFPTGFGGVSNINPIKLRGFVNTTEFTPAATPATTEDVHMSGYGGLPYFVNRLGSVDLSVQQLRDYLSSHVPTEDFRNLRPYELKQFYIKVRQVVEAESDDEEQPPTEGALALPSETAYAEPIEELPPETEEMKKARLSGFATSPYGVLYTHEGITYQKIGDKLYDKSGQYIGKFGKEWFSDFQYAPGGEELHEKNDGGESPRRWKKPIITEEPEEKKLAAPTESREERRGRARERHYGKSKQLSRTDSASPRGPKKKEETLNDYKPFSYETLTYYIKKSDDFEGGEKVYNDKMEVVGILKGSRDRWGGHKIRFKSKFKEIHEYNRP